MRSGMVLAILSVVSLGHMGTAKAVSCTQQDLGKTYSVNCRVAHQGIDNDSTNYYQELKIESESCDAAKGTVEGGTGLRLEFSGADFRGGFQILNDHSALWLQPKDLSPTYIRMAPEAIRRPLTLQVPLKEAYTDSNENLIQDLTLTCELK